MTALTDISGVGPTLAALFKAHGFDSAEAVAAATPEQLMQVPRIGALRAPVLIAQARELVGRTSAPKTAKPAIEQAQTQPENLATPDLDQGAKPDKKAKPKKNKAKKPKASAKKTKAEKSKASKSKKPAKKAKVKSADSKKTKTVKADKKSKSAKKDKADTSKKSAKKKKK